MNQIGGGVISIIAFALKLGFIALSGKDRIIILDEPFVALSANYTPYCSEMLRKVSESFNMQLIYVTHNKILTEEADNVIYL